MTQNGSGPAFDPAIGSEAREVDPLSSKITSKNQDFAVSPQGHLQEIGAQINAAHEKVQQAFRNGIDHAIRAGELLLAAKNQLPHGKWEKWLKASVCFSLRTARAYMQLAELDSEKRQRVADLPMREAIKAIAQRKYLTDEELRPERYVERKAIVVVGAGADYSPRPNVPPTAKEIGDDLVRQLHEAMHAVGDKISIDDVTLAFNERFGRRFGDVEPVVEKDVNPITFAWDKASRKKRHNFILARKIEIMRTQQQIAEGAFEVKFGDPGPIPECLRRDRVQP